MEIRYNHNRCYTFFLFNIPIFWWYIEEIEKEELVGEENEEYYDKGYE